MNDNPDLSEVSAVKTALTDLIMNCPELPQLEAQLAQFNIFRVLRADRNELRHSNMLAWLFTPEEQHSFGDLFLRKWLMQVLHQTTDAEPLPPGWISPIAVDVLDIERVEIHRELENIDLLFTIHSEREQWVVCIENKIDSSQSDGQLRRYHDIVERRFADATRRTYVFLTKHREQAAHPDYIHSSYQEVLTVLDQCLAERGDSLGREPRLLIEHYKQLLVDDFMEESETSKLARQIYLRHKVALDFIFENKGDPRFDTTNALEALLSQDQDRLGIVMGHTNKGYIRFLPKAWDVPANAGGTAWGPNSRYLVCEVNLWPKQAELHLTIGRAPEDWADLVWKRAAHPPFQREWKKRPNVYVKPFKAKSTISIEKLFELSGEDATNRLLEWLEIEFAKENFRQAVRELTELLSELGAVNRP